MSENDNEDFGYVSSVDPFTPEPTPPSVDAADEKALKRVKKTLATQIKLYQTISGMKQFNTKEFKANQREAMCDKYVELLSSLLKTVNNAIEGIEESQNGR